MVGAGLAARPTGCPLLPRHVPGPEVHPCARSPPQCPAQCRPRKPGRRSHRPARRGRGSFSLVDASGAGREVSNRGYLLRPTRTSVTAMSDVKVTAQGVHQWLQEMGWDFESRRAKYPTKYRYNKDTREQFKL